MDIIKTSGRTFGNINNKNFNSSDVVLYQNKMELVSNSTSTINDETNLYKLKKFKYLIINEILKFNNILVT